LRVEPEAAAAELRVDMVRAGGWRQNSLVFATAL
jgi:hypothetical protein